MPGDDVKPQGGKYRWYVVSMLFAIYALNFLDRQVINILGESIKRELNISDTRLGLLMGTAFALFYSTLGLPIARLADRANRVNIIALALLLWSGFTAACGLAGNYLQLFVLRLGVGIGEAGGAEQQQVLQGMFRVDHTRSVPWLSRCSMRVPRSVDFSAFCSEAMPATGSDGAPRS